MDHKSQNEQILSWLERGNPLTALDALREFNCLRLSGRIKELREAGHEITTTMITTVTNKRIASYRLAEKS